MKYPDCGFQYVQSDDSIAYYEKYSHPNPLREILGPSRWIIVPKVTDESILIASKRILIGHSFPRINKHENRTLLQQIEIPIQAFTSDDCNRRFLIMFESVEKSLEALRLLQRTQPGMRWHRGNPNY